MTKEDHLIPATPVELVEIQTLDAGELSQVGGGVDVPNPPPQPH
jgi:hypothetical protein